LFPFRVKLSWICLSNLFAVLREMQRCVSLDLGSYYCFLPVSAVKARAFPLFESLFQARKVGSIYADLIVAKVSAKLFCPSRLDSIHKRLRKFAAPHLGLTKMLVFATKQPSRTLFIQRLNNAVLHLSLNANFTIKFSLFS